MNTWVVGQLCRAEDGLVQACVALSDGIVEYAVISLRDARAALERVKTERELRSVRSQVAQATCATDRALESLEHGSIPAALNHINTARRKVSAVIF